MIWSLSRVLKNFDTPTIGLLPPVLDSIRTRDRLRHRFDDVDRLRDQRHDVHVTRLVTIRGNHIQGFLKIDLVTLCRRPFIRPRRIQHHQSRMVTERISAVLCGLPYDPSLGSVTSCVRSANLRRIPTVNRMMLA